LQPRNTQRIWNWRKGGHMIRMSHLIVVNGIYGAIIQTQSNIKKTAKRARLAPREN
jgi:hypothetical protein